MDIQKKLLQLAEKAYLIHQGELNMTSDQWVEWPLSDSERIYLQEKLSMDLSGYVRMVSLYDMIHVFKKHGDRILERKRGQIYITIQDLALIPEILRKGEAIDFSTEKHGLRSITYRTSLNGTYFYIEVVRTGRKKLAMKTLYKKI